MKAILLSERGGGKRQRISYLRCSSVPEIPPFPPTKLAGDMFIVNESSTSLRRFVEDCYVSQGHSSGQEEREGEREREREKERQDKGSSEGGRVRERALAAPIYAPVTEPSGAIKLAL